MVIKGDFNYKKAIILTPERINELNSILEKYYKDIRFEATTYDERTINFDSKDELINYDNFKKGRIKKLTVVCYDCSYRCLWIRFKYSSRLFTFIGYGITVECDYNFQTLKEEASLKNDLLLYFEKCKASYWITGKFSALGLCILISLISTIIQICNGTMKFDKTFPAVYMIIGTIIVIVLWSIPLLFDYFVMNRLFPTIAYKWGEEASRQERFEKSRNNIFWGVIIALVIGIATNIIYSFITK